MTGDTFKWYLENVAKDRQKSVMKYLGGLELEFIPVVENPDPKQLDELKKINGNLKTMLMEYAERCTTENKREIQ